MNEAPGQESASEFGAGSVGEGVSPGTMLRQAREAAGLQVEALAVALKVPPRKLEALEADRFDQLPDAVFVRALAASVCRNLRVDPAPILERLPATARPRLASAEGGINAPFRSPRDGAGPSWIEHFSRPALLAVFALLLGALVLILLPSHRDDVAAAFEPAPAPVEDAVLPPAAEPATVNAASPASSATTALSPSAAAALAEPGATSAPASRAASAALTEVPAASGAAASEGIVVFKVKAASWIQVTDAKGAVPLRKLLAAGESAAASGALPLTVTVGSVDATEVQVRGKRFDMASVARDNVARFEVK